MAQNRTQSVYALCLWKWSHGISESFDALSETTQSMLSSFVDETCMHGKEAWQEVSNLAWRMNVKCMCAAL